ncbi:MAG: hypothetical protein JW770_06365 [Actinobacteria bacterium]|nr:hypothetical protein [Actinomycetota bacterium]
MTRINIILDEDFLKKVDCFSTGEKMTRSGFIREAVSSYIALKEEEEKLHEKAKTIQESIDFFRKMGEKNKNWDGVKEINRSREQR